MYMHDVKEEPKTIVICENTFEANANSSKK
jgi:hypothetical protein